ncbi:MAG: class I SAM-dependent methyltransferase [Actinomycetota bacterium]|nr:class I SAM-dependent methyltransferase [Actinomycetota bacterium]
MEDHPLPDTPSAQTAHRLIAEGPAGRRLGRLGSRGRRAGEVLGRLLRGRLPFQQAVDRSLLDSIGHVDRRVDTVVARLDGEVAGLADRAQARDVLLDDLILAVDGLRERLDVLEGRLGHPDELPRIEDVLNASRARPYLAQPFEVWDEPQAGRVLGFRAHGGDFAGSHYERLEERFRGPEERVAQLQAPYVALLEGHAPILDAGCGRGELLDLLRERGIAYRGIDLDEGMVARCAAKGHADVEVADVNAHLRGVDDGTYGAIFSAQVVEHLPYDALRELLDLAVGRLRPGGLFVAETVNPHSPVALRAFWTDLTHRHPIFPEVALALCEAAGFATAYVFHPMGSGDVDVDSWREAAYAVVASTGP